MSRPTPSASSSSSNLPPKSKPKAKSQSQKSLSPSISHVNPSPVPEMSAPAPLPVLPNGERQRGPVEEVIAKRMRQLGKKLQRYRTYALQNVEILNGDQKAALISLPGLEGAYKELEDLIREKGPVDEQELIQAAKMREASEAAESTVEAAASERVEAFQSALVHPLSRFLRLHALLHPARPDDYEQLTFGRLDLPSALSDEVQATDVLRVGRMYEDLLAGEEAAKNVLSALAKGVTGNDEENDHIHHLIHLLDEPEQAQEGEAQGDAEPAESSTYGTATPSEAGQPDEVVPEDVITPASLTRSGPDMPNGYSDEKSTPTGMAINFLQEDELESGIEDSYEVIPMPEPQETQLPAEEEISATSDMPDTSAAQSQAQKVPAFSAPSSQKAWAEMGDDDDEPAFASSAIPASPPKVEEVTIPAETGEPAIAVVQKHESASEPPISETIIEAPTSVESAQSPQQTPIPRPVQTAPIPARPRTSSQQIHRPRPKERSVVVDEDGFEMKVRRTSSQAHRGRGGRGGGSGGIDKGRGGGSGRGGGGRGGSGVAGQGQGQRPSTKDGSRPPPVQQ